MSAFARFDPLLQEKIVHRLGWSRNWLLRPFWMEITALSLPHRRQENRGFHISGAIGMFNPSGTRIAGALHLPHPGVDQ